MSGFNGKWQLTELTNHVEYLKATGVESSRAEQAAKNPATVMEEIAIDGNSAKVTHHMDGKKINEMTATIGSECEVTAPDGHKLKVVSTFPTATTAHTDVKSPFVGTVDSEIVGGVLTRTHKVGSVVMVQKFKKV